MRGSRTWWRRVSVALALLAAPLPFASRALVGPPGGIVHVRWQPSLSAAARQDLEARFRLVDGERLENATWRYDLIDPSSANIRALVGDPAVEDTHSIDRPRGALDPSAVRTDRRQRFDEGSLAVWVADRLAALLVVFAGFLIAAGASGRAETPRALRLGVRGLLAKASASIRTAGVAVARPLSRGVPELDAWTAGVFRIVFGVAVLWFFSSRPVDALRLSAIFDPHFAGDLHAAVFQWLRAHPGIVNLVTPWLLVTAAAFTLGFVTRLTYALFVAGGIVWAFAAVALDNTHPHSTLILTMVALLPSRWGDALSIDAWLSRARGRARAAGPPSKAYGYSVWVPGLVFGVAFAAAAWAKLAPHGLSWILNGSVKYHFITDSGNAVVDWGLQLAAHPWLAVLASLGALVIEASVITAAFTRDERYRLVAGAGALALLVGFRLFMGLFWAGWWILLLGFLPWQRLGRLKPAPTGAPTNLSYVEAGFSRPARDQRRVTMAQTAAVVFVLAQQIVVSALGIERAPMFSNYPMYSETYASPAAFDASMPPAYRIVVTMSTGPVALSCNPSEDLVDEFRAALGGSMEAAATVWRAVLGCNPDLVDARQVTFEQSRRTFDWDRLTFTTTRRPVVIGALTLRPTRAAPSSN